MHDGGHQANSEHRWINRLMALAMDLVGDSSYIWQWKHARFHRTWVNVAGHDSDIDLGVLGRLSPLQPRRPWHRWQHLYLWPLYGVTAIGWHLFGDFRDMITGTVGERPFDRPKGWDLTGFVGGKLVFFTLAGLPLVFQIAHVVEYACREYGVTYRENRTFGAGIASHYRLLRQLGQPVASTSPASAALLPEPVPHGWRVGVPRM